MKPTKILFGLVFMFLLVMSSAFATLNDAKVYYSFDDSDLVGANPLDISGNNISATNDGATTGVAGILNEQFDYDGINDDVYFPEPFSLNGDFTVGLWITPDTVSGNQEIVANSLSAASPNLFRIQRLGADVYVSTKDGTYINIDTTVNLASGVPTHFVVVRNQSLGQCLIYADGSYVTNINCRSGSLSSSNFIIGTGVNDNRYNGKIDEYVMYNRTLTSQEVSQLYNLNSNPYTINFLTVQAENYWDNSTINEFNATASITNASGTFNFTGSTTNGTIDFNEISKNVLINITVFKEGYLLNDTYTNYNTSNSPLTARLSEAQISLDAQALITNATISPANFTIEGQTFSDGQLINISAGDYNVTFSKAGWYNKTEQITVLAGASQSFTITDVYDSQVNVTFRDFLENNTRNNVSGTYGSDNFNYSANFDATPNSWVTFNWIKDQPVNFTVDNQLYALETKQFTPDTISFNYAFYVYDTNSFFITIKDEVTQETLNGTNFTVDFISTASSFEDTTTNGTIYATLLTPTDYELRYYSTNSVDYPLRSAFYTITNQTFTNITLYTLNESDTTVSQATITFRVLNADFQPVENAKIVVQRYYLSENGYVSVFERFTNTNGEAVGVFETIDAFYKYQIYFNDVLKYSSPDAGTQFSADETIIKYIDTTTVQSEIIYDIQNIANTLIFVPQTATTGYFQFNYTNPSLYNICLTVSSFNGQNQSCQATTSGSIQLSVTGSNTSNIAFTAVASALSDSLGTYQAFASLTKTYTATALDSEDVRNSATFIFILLQISLTLALIRWPIWSLITQTIMFVIIIAIPFQLVSLTLASGSYFIAIVLIGIFLIKSRGAR